MKSGQKIGKNQVMSKKYYYMLKQGFKSTTLRKGAYGYEESRVSTLRELAKFIGNRAGKWEISG